MLRSSRRHLLAGAGLGAGALFLEPMRRTLIREALGQTSPRLFFYITGGGFPPEYWPKRGATERDFTLDEAMSPLSPLKDKLVFVERLFNPHAPHLHGNSSCAFLTLTAPSGDEETAQPTSASFDRVVARTLSRGAAIASLNVCTHEVDDSDPQLTVSSDGANAKVPAHLNPIKAFESIFGGGGTSSMPVMDLLAADRSVLDAVRGDVSKVSAGLAGLERMKLEQYLTSLRELEKQLGDLVTARGSCEAPARPASSVYSGGRRSPKKPVYDAFLSLTATAVACGLTRVVTFLAAEGELDFLPLEGGGQCGTHQMWHGSGTANDHRRYYQYQFGNLAALHGRLSSFKEGSGSVADTTLFVNLNLNCGPHHNGNNDYYAMLLGTLGGKLHGGRHLNFTRGARSMADLLVALSALVGAPMTSFGQSSLNKGPLPGLV